MTATMGNRLLVAASAVYGAAILAFVVAIAQNHLNLIFHDYPLDYNEPSMLVTTSTIAGGGSPYSLESQPERNSVYPVLFSVLVAPLSLLFGNTLELHRILVGLFLLASSGACYYLCRLESISRIDSFVAAALWYAALLYYSTPVAGPNGLGLFLFMSAITIPYALGFSTRSLAVAIVLGVLAFYAKQYFIASLGYVALYVFLAESKKRAVYFGLAAMLFFVFVLSLVVYTSPYFLENSFFSVQSSAKIAASDEQVWIQLKQYGKVYMPLLVLLASALVASGLLFLRRRGQDVAESPSNGLVNLLDFDKPLFMRRPNYIWVCCACSLVIIVLVLGKNRGNHMTYLYQLISPFFLIGVFALTARMPTWRWPVRVLIVANLYSSYAVLPKDFSVKQQPWSRIRQEIDTSDDIYASPLFLSEVMHKGSPVYLSGATPYFPYGVNDLAFYEKTGSEESVPSLWSRYADRIQYKIRNREFDLLLLDGWMQWPVPIGKSDAEAQKLLRENYELLDTVLLPLLDRPGGGTYRVQIWRPREIPLDA